MLRRSFIAQMPFAKVARPVIGILQPSPANKENSATMPLHFWCIQFDAAISHREVRNALVRKKDASRRRAQKPPILRRACAYLAHARCSRFRRRQRQPATGLGGIPVDWVCVQVSTQRGLNARRCSRPLFLKLSCVKTNAVRSLARISVRVVLEMFKTDGAGNYRRKTTDGSRPAIR